MKNTITLQIPITEYGTIATLAAVANMPIDKYVVSETCPETNKKSSKKTT